MLSELTKADTGRKVSVLSARSIGAPTNRHCPDTFTPCLAEDGKMLLDLIIQDGFDPKRKGPDEWCSPCPACGGRDRLVIHPVTGRYWCRCCGIKGDTIEYLRRFRGMSFHQATEVAGKAVPLHPATTAPRSRQDAARTKNEPPPEDWTAQAEELTAEAHAGLLADPERMDWLRTKRGLTKETAERFRLGWIERNLCQDRAAWALPPSLRDDGKPKKLFFPAGLVIPGPERLRIRRAEPGTFGKYFVVPGSSNRPLVIGTDHPPVTTGAVIVESELDAILLHQEIPGPLLIIATGSTSNGPDQAMVDDMVKRPFVLVALDSDKAGAKAAWQKWMNTIPNATRAPIPATWAAKDHTDAFIAGHDLRQWFAMALTLIGHAQGKVQTVDVHVEPEVEEVDTTTEPEKTVEPAPEQTITGLPCGGCGSTNYRQVANGYEFPDGGRVGGWHCGSPTCGVKLLTGNHEVNQKRTRPMPEVSVAICR